MGDAFAGEEALDHADSLVLAVALHHGVDAEHEGVGGERAGARAEDHPTAGHVIQLHDALGDIEGVVIGQRDHPGAQPDAVGALAGRGQEHLRRGDHLPAGGVVLAAPEFVEAQPVQVFGEGQVAAQLQHRMLADRVVGREKGAELKARHAENSWRRDGLR